MKRGIIISFFVFIISNIVLSAQEFKSTLWASIYRGTDMRSFLMVEFGDGIDCRISHAYLRKGEDFPFEWDATREEWYRTRDNLIIIQDNWGEFIPLKIISPTGLETKMGGETILLKRITPQEREKLLEEFHLTGQ